MLAKTANFPNIFFFFSGSAVYTPEDGDNWMLAKLNLQITDLGYSQIVEHLAKVNIVTSFWKFIATLPHFTPSWVEWKYSFYSQRDCREQGTLALWLPHRMSTGRGTRLTLSTFYKVRDFSNKSKQLLCKNKRNNSENSSKVRIGSYSPNWKPNLTIMWLELSKWVLSLTVQVLTFFKEASTHPSDFLPAKLVKVTADNIATPLTNSVKKCFFPPLKHGKLNLCVGTPCFV